MNKAYFIISYMHNYTDYGVVRIEILTNNKYNPYENIYIHGGGVFSYIYKWQYLAKAK